MLILVKHLYHVAEIDGVRSEVASAIERGCTRQVVPQKKNKELYYQIQHKEQHPLCGINEGAGGEKFSES